MKRDKTWSNSIPVDKTKAVLTSDLCSNEIYYIDLKKHEELFTKQVTNLTSRTE